MIVSFRRGTNWNKRFLENISNTLTPHIKVECSDAVCATIVKRLQMYMAENHEQNHSSH